MVDNQQVDRPAAVTQAKRDSYLRHVRIHIELLQDSLAGREFGCGVGLGDRDEIEKRLLDIWNIALGAELAVLDVRPAADNTAPPPSAQVIPIRSEKRRR